MLFVYRMIGEVYTEKVGKRKINTECVIRTYDIEALLSLAGVQGTPHILLIPVSDGRPLVDALLSSFLDATDGPTCSDTRPSSPGPWRA